MTRFTATATAWTELTSLPARIAVQNVGFGNLYMHIGASAPATLFAAGAPAVLLEHRQVEPVDLDAGDKVYVSSEFATCDGVIVKNT